MNGNDHGVFLLHQMVIAALKVHQNRRQSDKDKKENVAAYCF
jgi:hypothetical protein